MRPPCPSRFRGSALASACTWRSNRYGRASLLPSASIDRPYAAVRVCRRIQFASLLLVCQVLLLWDRILGFDSLELLPLLAVAILLFRCDTIMATDEAEAVRS